MRFHGVELEIRLISERFLAMNGPGGEGTWVNVPDAAWEWKSYR